MAIDCLRRSSSVSTFIEGVISGDVSLLGMTMPESILPPDSMVAPECLKALLGMFSSENGEFWDVHLPMMLNLFSLTPGSLAG